MPLSYQMEHVQNLSNPLIVTLNRFLKGFPCSKFVGLMITEGRNHEFWGEVYEGIKIHAITRNTSSPFASPINIHMTVSHVFIDEGGDVLGEWEELFDTILIDPDSFAFY